MFAMFALVMTLVSKSKNLIGSFSSNEWLFSLSFKFLIRTKTSTVSLDDVLSVVIIKRNDMYDIGRLIFLFSSSIEHKTICEGPTERQ